MSEPSTPVESAAIASPYEAACAAAARDDPAAVLARFQQACAKGLSPDLAVRWGLLLVEAGLEAELGPLRRHLPTAGLPAPLVDALAMALRASDSGPEDSTDHAVPADPDDADDDLLDPPLALPSTPARDEVTVALFLRWFAGRRDLYSRQWHDERRGRSGYRPVREPLTESVARAHLEGRLTLGQYLLFNDDSVSFAVLDLDLRPDPVAAWKLEQGEDASAAEHPVLRAFAARLMEAASRVGIPLFGEDSGGRGLHLWAFFEPRIPARAARSLLGQVLLGAGGPPAEVGVEVFPKQDRAGERGLSSLVKLPLGLHQATMRRCHLLDAALSPVTDAREALARIEAVPAGLVGDLVARRLVPLPAPELSPREPIPAPSPAPTPRTLAQALREVESGPAERAACDRMLEGCGILRAIAKRAYDTHALTSDEARAVVYTLGLVGPSSRIASELLAVAGVASKELERVRRGLQSPTGCKRLREACPDLARECVCPLDKNALPYPTPALFAVGEIAPRPPDHVRFAPWTEAEPLRVADPFETIGDSLRRIEHRLEQIERGEQPPPTKTGPPPKAGPG